MKAFLAFYKISFATKAMRVKIIMIMIKNYYDWKLNMIKNTIDVCGIFKSEVEAVFAHQLNNPKNLFSCT